MKPINVLIIEQNILARQAIAGTLRKHSHFNVAGVFGDVEQIENKVKHANPDVILLDIESSEGLELLKNLKKSFPSCPVIVLSRRTPEGAKLALTALEAGALDFITKPRLGQNLLFASRHFTKRLIPIVEMAVRQHDKENNFTHIKEKLVEDPQEKTLRKKDLKRRKPRVMVIGACTGGPLALAELISHLPEKIDIPIVVVQHFPKYFTSELADLLNRKSKVNIEEAFEGGRLEPGTVWIAPGGYHCEISGWSCKPFLKAHKGPRELDARPSINNLFRSATNIYGRDVLAILLSGHGEDGFEGLKSVKRAGGMAIVQHPASALVPDLSRQAVKYGLADYRLSPEKMANMITELVGVYSAYPETGSQNIDQDRKFKSQKVSVKNLTN